MALEDRAHRAGLLCSCRLEATSSSKSNKESVAILAEYRTIPTLHRSPMYDNLLPSSSRCDYNDMRFFSSAFFFFFLLVCSSPPIAKVGQRSPKHAGCKSRACLRDEECMHFLVLKTMFAARWNSHLCLSYLLNKM